MLPKGMATFLPEAAVHKRHVEETILSSFLSWGYQEVIPPIFEYLDVITLGMGDDLIQKGYKFVDRESGRLMLLRPDVTPQIARMAGMMMADLPKPLRLCYRANVFRHEDEHAGRAREIFQVGGELIGSEGPEADAEIISIAVESLKKLGLEDFKIAIGQVEFFHGLMDSIELSLEQHKLIHGAIVRKDKSRLIQTLKEWMIPEARIEQMASILTLLGQEEVIDKAWKLSSSAACRSALMRLREVYKILVSSGWKDYIVLDLAEVRGSDYYTGVVFELFSKDLGVPLGRGGRYDSLIGKFGPPCASIGFAFDLEPLQWAWQRSGQVGPQSEPDFIVWDTQGDTVRLFGIAGQIRAKGYRVIQQSEKTTLREVIFRAKNLGARQMLVLEDDEKASLIDCRSGKRRSGKIRALISKL